MKNIKIRSVLRALVFLYGSYQFVLYAVGGFADVTYLFSAGMMMFIGATNFCSQCPLLSAFTKYFKKNRKQVVSIDKL